MAGAPGLPGSAGPKVSECGWPTKVGFQPLRIKTSSDGENVPS